MVGAIGGFFTSNSFVSLEAVIVEVVVAELVVAVVVAVLGLVGVLDSSVSEP